MPSVELPSSVADSCEDDQDDVTAQEFPIYSQPDTVCVDVSECGYARQFRSGVTSTLCRNQTPLLTDVGVDDSDVAAEHCRLSSWRKTICDVGDASKKKPRRQIMVFGAVDVDRSALFRGLVTKKTASSTARRSLVTAGSDNSGRFGRTTSTSRQCKLSAAACGGCVDDRRRLLAESRASYSWRESLRSLFKGVIRTKSSIDLWATAAAQHQDGGSLTTGALKAPISFRRANSLPRTLKAMKRHSGCDSATKTKTKSLEDSSDRSSVTSLRPEVTSAGERLGRSLSLSRCQYKVKSATFRAVRPQSMEVHIVALDETGRPSSCTGSSNGTITERRVHVNIPDQPWTKPFANVQLRRRTARVVASDKYQSSSGIKAT